MAGLKLYTGNRQETLFDGLVELLREPVADPFIPEIILVQSKGMERWLRQELAVRTGVCANIRFPFPNTAVRELFECILGSLPDNSLFSTEYLPWRILGLLRSVTDDPEFQEVARYLADDPTGLKGWQLALKIAMTFDSYLLYRPDMLLNWENGTGSDWQPILWRKLVETAGPAHRAALRKTFLAITNESEFPPGRLPSRISIFGIPYLPPFHLESIAAVARHTDIHLFLLLPSSGDWENPGVPNDARPIPRAESPPAALQPAVDSALFQAGNPLLLSWGRLGADFYRRLRNRAGQVAESTAFQLPGQDTLLHCMQTDVMLNRHRRLSMQVNMAISDGGPELHAPIPDDRSIQLHSCHSPGRELEVLHDRLLDLFERLPNLEPRDILVMTPDIEGYAPHIEAVFGTGQNASQHIPYSIADRQPLLENVIVRAFFKLLDLADSRFEVSGVVDLLEMPPVMRRFNLQPGDLDRITMWIQETGIRWGYDTQDRERLGLPGFEENSWDQGIRRLLLGFAMPAADQRIFSEILPYDEIEGGAGLVLGRFLDFLRDLKEAFSSLHEWRTLAGWGATFRGLSTKFFALDADYRTGIENLNRQLAALEDIPQRAGFEESVSLELVRNYLTRLLGREEFSRDFLSGSVTFCSMIPMRSIPFRVIALLGMDHDRFPQSEPQLQFDKLRGNYLSGDRSLRDEHRYLFLEALLSARDCLYVSFVGQSIRDNSQIPPSVLVSELIESIRRRFPSTSAAEPHMPFVVRHCLQPFSRNYFSATKAAEGLFSYSRENFEALTSKPERKWWELPFISTPLSEPDETLRTVELETLKRFFRDPAAFFFKQRLGIYLELDEAGLDDVEPMEMDRLTQYGIEDRWISRILNSEEIGPEIEGLRLKGVLPPGPVGRACIDQIQATSRDFAGQVSGLASQRRRDAIDIALEFGPFRVNGQIGGIRESELLRFRPAKVKPKDFLAAWIDFLALLCLERPGDPRQCLLLGVDRNIVKWVFQGIDHPQGHFENLLRIYWRGLSEPLPLFPEASMAYAESGHRGGTREAALRAAAEAWENDHGGRQEAERDGPYHSLAFGHINPLSSDFEAVALSVWLPLLQHRQR